MALDPLEHPGRRSQSRWLHDVRSPLNAIHLFAALLADELVEEPLERETRDRLSARLGQLRRALEDLTVRLSRVEDTEHPRSGP